jgi:magnesium transporter
MILAYLKSKNLKPENITLDNISLLSDAVWIDVFCPTPGEDKLLESALKIAIPTREEMAEIEVSSRLYTGEEGAVYMTANMLSKSETIQPMNDAVTLIYSNDKLITIRYIEAHSFALFISRLTKLSQDKYHATNLILELLDATIDRLADILEHIGLSLDNFSQAIFRNKRKEDSHDIDYMSLLQEIGSNGDLNSKVGESLVTFNLLSTFFGKTDNVRLSIELKSALALLEKDIKALSAHVNFLSNKVNFLLDATLGMVTIEQNGVIKLFTIAAVMFLPPTLIATIYGMNFKFMPELSWYFGYPLVIGIMIVSSVLAYLYFKKKKWL